MYSIFDGLYQRDSSNITLITPVQSVNSSRDLLELDFNYTYVGLLVLKSKPIFFQLLATSEVVKKANNHPPKSTLTYTYIPCFWEVGSILGLLNFDNHKYY